jgi:hypothetical protein
MRSLGVVARKVLLLIADWLMGADMRLEVKRPNGAAELRAAVEALNDHHVLREQAARIIRAQLRSETPDAPHRRTTDR